VKFEEYIRYDAIGLSQLVRDRSVTGEDLVATARSAVDRLDPQLNATIELWPEVTGPDPTYTDGALYGVPFLIKDILNQRQGRKLELGSRLAQGLRSAHNSYNMTAFDRLGLITMGRTALPEFGFSCTTESVLLGPTRNPWNLQRMAGGSSGGSAAAIAAGYVPLAHGNDGAGSIRGPAACCGLVGLKVSRGRVSLGPDLAEGFFGLGVELALSRSIRDTALVLDALSKPMPGDPFLISRPEASYLELIERAPRRMKIGYTTRPWYEAPIDKDVVDAIDRCAQTCCELGHVVEEARPEFDYSLMREALIIIMATGMASWVQQLSLQTGRSVSSDTLEAATLAMIEHGHTLEPGDLFRALDNINRVTRAVGPFFEDYDLLLTPATAKPAQPLGTYNQNAPVVSHEQWFDHKATFTPFLALFNVTGHPAVSLPAAMSRDGLPIGVQFVARFGREEDLLMIGRQLEDVVSWEKRLVANINRLNASTR
jgi:amidase